jgi:hypothetical protein
VVLGGIWRQIMHLFAGVVNTYANLQKGGATLSNLL